MGFSPDDTHAFFTIWRVFNVVAGTVALILLGWTVHGLKGGFSNAGRTFVNAHLVLMLAAVWSALESLVQNHPIGGRSALITFGILLTFFSLHRFREDQKTQQ